MLRSESISAFGTVALMAIAFGLWGCNSSEVDHQEPTGANVAPTSRFDLDEQTSTSGWPAGDDAERSLSELAGAVQAKFTAYTELEDLIYPDGWVRRVLAVDQVRHEMSEAETQPVGAVIVTYQRQSTLIHPTREAAADDPELFPYASLQSKDQLDSPLRRPNPKVELRIEYELRDTAEGRYWVRLGWSAEPDVAEGQDFLERIGVP